jgi:hypothetical protein
LWNGIQTFLLSDASRLSREAHEKAMMASQQRSLDAALFVQFARDYYSGRTELAQFFLDRARPELREAIKAWVATKPAKDPNAPSTPFAMPQYRVPAEAQDVNLSAQSSVAHDKAQTANLTSDTYSLLGVLFTASLFLAGLVSGIDDRKARQVLLILSISAMVIATVVIVKLPLAHRG